MADRFMYNKSTPNEKRPRYGFFFTPRDRQIRTLGHPVPGGMPSAVRVTWPHWIVTFDPDSGYNMLNRLQPTWKLFDIFRNARSTARDFELIRTGHFRLSEPDSGKTLAHVGFFVPSTFGGRGGGCGRIIAISWIKRFIGWQKNEKNCHHDVANM